MNLFYVVTLLAALLPIDAAHASDDTKQALRDFGWEGTWSSDCSIPNVFRPGTKAVLPKLQDQIPVFGPPTRTAELIYESGPLAGIVSKFTFTVTSAKLVADNKLVIVSVENKSNWTYEAVVTKVDGKMVALRSKVSGNAMIDSPAGDLAIGPLKAGEPFSYQNAENGVSLTAAGAPRGTAILEKCRD